MRPTILALLLAACGPGAPAETSSSTGDAPHTTSTTAPAPLTTDATTTTATTLAPTTGDALTSTTDATTTTGTQNFIMPTDGGNGCSSVRGDPDLRCKNCWPWTPFPECAEGDKCVPDNEGGETWDDTDCVPVARDPAHPGEPCTVDPEAHQFIDDCDAESLCMGLDPDSLAPVCVPTCKGSPEAPECPAGSICVSTHDAQVIPCLPACDPLASTCPMGHPCLPVADFEQELAGFACRPPLPEPPGELFAPCADLLGCAPGLACEDAALALECDPQQSDRCCLPLCDLDAPACPGVMQQCEPAFPGDPPPALTHLGLCRLP